MLLSGNPVQRMPVKILSSRDAGAVLNRAVGEVGREERPGSDTYHISRAMLVVIVNFSWTSARHVRVCPSACYSDLEDLTEVFVRMSAGTSSRKLPLWADFSEN